MSTTPLPLRQYVGHQWDLVWRGALADGELGRCSNMGAFIRSMEGGGGHRRTPDLLDDPEASLEDIYERLNLSAASRAARIDRALRAIDPSSGMVLVLAYMTTPQQGLGAWPQLENLVSMSQVAHSRWKRSQTRLGLGEWLVRLSVRKVGELRAGIRTRPRATPAECEIVIAIQRDCERTIALALDQYVTATRRLSHTGRRHLDRAV